MTKPLVKLFKRPSSRYQNLQTFTVSMEEFASMAQGRIDRVMVHDQNNGLRAKLKVPEILESATITAFPSYYVVDYSHLGVKETPEERRKPSKSRANTSRYQNTEYEDDGDHYEYEDDGDHYEYEDDGDHYEYDPYDMF